MTVNWNSGALAMKPMHGTLIYEK